MHLKDDTLMTFCLLCKILFLVKFRQDTFWLHYNKKATAIINIKKACITFELDLLASRCVYRLTGTLT